MELEMRERERERERERDVSYLVAKWIVWWKHIHASTPKIHWKDSMGYERLPDDNCLAS